jgi:D-ribose pyranose/furanose isomerase RbsD
MKKMVTNSSSCRMNRPATARAAGRVGFLAFVALILILAGGGLWYWRSNRPRTVETAEAAAPSGVLSETTTRILAGLDSPIDLSLFAPSDVSALPAALGGYVSRVKGLLAEYESAAAGKVRVSKRDPQTDKTAKAAAGAAGIVPFASENGEIVYLGLTVGNGARVETVSPLAPEWEAALESDISRAISRVTASAAAATARPGAPTPAAATPVDPAISEELLKTFPDLASRSFDDAAQVLRESAFAQFKAAAIEMQAKVQLAQQALAAARQNKSEAEQEAALKAFQEIQAEQANKLKAIAARLQERLVVLQRLKDTSTPPAPPRSP